MSINCCKCIATWDLLLDFHTIASDLGAHSHAATFLIIDVLKVDLHFCSIVRLSDCLRTHDELGSLASAATAATTSHPYHTSQFLELLKLPERIWQRYHGLAASQD